MINVIRNTFCIFKRNKEFIYLITIQPLLIFLLMSFLLPYSKTHNIAVCDHSENHAVSQALEKMEGIKAVNVSEDAVTEKLINGSAELAVIVSADGSAQIISFGSSEAEGAVTLCVENALSGTGEAIETSINAAPKRGMPIGNSLGFMIFKTLTASNLLAALLIQERNNKMKDRIRESQKIRGIGTSAVNVLCHPFLTAECILVPMLIRASKVADELSASVQVRGMKLGGAYSSYRKAEIGGRDIVLMILGTAAAALIITADISFRRG